MTDPAKQMKTNQYVVIFMSVVLLFGAVSAVMITAEEYDPEVLVWMHLGIDLLMTALLPVLMTGVARSSEPSGLKTIAMLIGVVGFLSGLVKLGARFFSEAGWWTGHYTYAF
jgi:hypothetical protein